MNVGASPNQLYARLRSCQIASTPKSLAALQADLKSTRILQSQRRRFSGPVFERHHFPVFKRSIRTMATEVPKAEYRQLGKSGLRVSVPILGAMSIGDKRWQKWVTEEDEAIPLLKAAYDRGLNTWDTANVYSNGASEEIIGKAIKKYNIPRHKLVICTKCCGTVREGNSPEVLALQDIDKTVDYVNQRGLSRQAIFAAVNASLALITLSPLLTMMP
ncbi:hypothetical protein ABVK25_005614 [Lepraria finkii]|uniref:NADP-dependent oxidoreductase domain-containing protein n=1 Tax=Lepraria finkii TaxID=1340010 RepID=A0ABR4B8Y5_9LECA